MSSFVLYAAGTVLMLALVNLLGGNATSRSVSYTEFKGMVRADQMQSVVVSDTRIRGTLKKAGQTVDAVRVTDPGLLAELEQHGVTVTGEATTQWWSSLIVWLLPLLVLMFFWNRALTRLGPNQALSFGRSRAKVYADDDVKVTFADVAGIDEATEELREIVDFLKNPKKYTDLGGRIPKGVLLVGPPGTGKTLLARAVAGEARVPFFSLSGSEFVEMFVGVGAARVRDLFAQAEQRAPCIIFIDELDALGKTRMASPLGTHEEREQTLNQLLAEMDGFDARKGIIVMSATNRPEVLDVALLRPGRFDRRVVVDRPDVRGREAILRLHARAVKLASNVDLQVVASRTTGFAGADLASLVNEATLLAARRNQVEVAMSDFEEAIDRVLTGLKRKRLMSPRERERVAAHEAGHAIVASLLPGADPVHKISIVQRGYEALGHTLQLPSEDRYLRTRQELRAHLAVFVAGRAAEEIVFNETSTGGQNDLQRATEVARAMVAEYGMSDAIGPVAVDLRTRSPYLPVVGTENVERVSEETAREVDHEVRLLMTDAHETASRLLQEHRTTLDAVVRLLLEHEVVEGEDVRRLLAGDTVPAPRLISPPSPSSTSPRQAA
ncbi:MAG TPA: ATP-dependent zinc metalloprotease FtsH [Vicinamibacterales bacterium]